VPQAAALPWYERGTDALRNGAYYQASKAFGEAIGIDNRSLWRMHASRRPGQNSTTLDKAKMSCLLPALSWETARRYHRWMRFIWHAITATVQRDFDAAVKGYAEIGVFLLTTARLRPILGSAQKIAVTSTRLLITIKRRSPKQ